MKKYYALYSSWLRLLESKDSGNSQIEFRVRKVHLKIKEARLEEFPEIYRQFFKAYSLYDNGDYQECYNVLGRLYGEVMADITDRKSPTWGMNFVVGKSVITVTQDLIDGRIINMQLRR